MTDPNHRDTIKERSLPEGDGTPPAPMEESVADDGGKPRFDPYRFQRITLPPGLRADFLRWSKEARNERVPEDTLPPHGGLVGTRPASMGPRHKLATGAVLLLVLMLLALVVGYSRGRPPPAEPRVTAAPPEPAPSAETPPPVPEVVPEVVPVTEPPVITTASGALPEPPHPHFSTVKKRNQTAKPADSRLLQQTTEPPPERPRGESALDRPFATPQ
jgi:hypothetical protein